MRPDAGELFEIGGAVLAVALVAPEIKRRGGERLGAAQLARLVDRGLAAVVAQDAHVHAQRRALQFAAVHRQNRAAGEEAGDDVGAAGDRRQAQVLLDLAVDVIEAFRRQSRCAKLFDVALNKLDVRYRMPECSGVVVAVGPGNIELCSRHVNANHPAGGAGMPLAVKRLAARGFPMSLNFSDADLLQRLAGAGLPVDLEAELELRRVVEQLGNGHLYDEELITLPNAEKNKHVFLFLTKLGKPIQGKLGPGSAYVRQRARFALVIQDTDEPLKLSHHALWSSFKLTNAEAELASLLLEGYSVGECAHRQSLAKQTLRNHLGSIMKKTQTNRQPQLVALLTRLALSTMH